MAAVLLTAAVGCSLLAGCGTDTDTSASAEESGSDIPAEAYEDVVSYLTDGAVSGDDVVYTVNGIDITAYEYFYYLTYEEYVYTNQYYSTYYEYPDLTEEMSDGTTLADYIEQDAYSSAVTDAVVYAAALEAGVTLSDEYQEDLDSYISDNIESLGEELWETAVDEDEISEDDFTDEEKAAWIAEAGSEQLALNMMSYSTTEDAVETFYEKNYYAQQYKEDLFAEGGEEEPDEYDLMVYISDNGVYACRYILIYDTSETALESAEEICSELSALSGDEFDEAFAAYAENNIDGNTTGEYVFDDYDTLVDGFAELVAELSVGEVGVTEETDYGYFVIVRDEVTADSVYTSTSGYTVLDQYTDDAFDELSAEWAADAEVTDTGALDSFDYYEFLDALEEFRELLEEYTGVSEE